MRVRWFRELAGINMWQEFYFFEHRMSASAVKLNLHNREHHRGGNQ